MFFICIAAMCAAASPVFAAERLKSDESVMFLPGLAVEQADGAFIVNIDAWVFELESRRVLSSMLASWMGVDLGTLSPAQKALFIERTRYFRTDSERGKRLRVRLAGEVFTMPRTDPAGRTHDELRIGREQIQWTGPDGFGSVSWTLEAPGHAAHGQKGYASVIPAEGVSIVSDIDDTIKISNVLDKKALVRKTFLAPFEAAPGMSQWYREMAGNERLGFFHYLSSSPIQLFAALSEFLKDERFPPGILHLRESTSWRTMHADRETSIAHKKNILTRLLTTYPQRKFILIGDSGENDPEIYADIARIYPEQILAIHIRNVTNEERDAPRYQKTFEGISPQIWHIRD